MARKPIPAPESKETPVNEALLVQDFSAANALAVLETTATENVVALAHQLGYEGALSVGALEDGIRFYQRHTAEACLELGKRLVLLKEASLHGEFMPRLKLLGIDDRAARRFMSAAVKFSKRASAPVLKAATSQSKLLELLVLDDEEMAELAEGGTVRGISLDDVATMGVHEMRHALREARAEKEATEKLLATKDAKINKLSRHTAKLTPDEKLIELQKDATAWMNDALGCVRGQLRGALLKLRDHDESQDHSIFMAGLVGQVQADLSALREEFNLPDISNAADLQLAAEMAQWAK